MSFLETIRRKKMNKALLTFASGRHILSVLISYPAFFSSSKRRQSLLAFSTGLHRYPGKSIRECLPTGYFIRFFAHHMAFVLSQKAHAPTDQIAQFLASPTARSL